MGVRIQEDDRVHRLYSLDELEKPVDIIRLVARRTFTPLKPEPTRPLSNMAGQVVKYVWKRSFPK